MDPRLVAISWAISVSLVISGMAGGADGSGRDEQGMDHHLFAVWMLMAWHACENLLKLGGRIADHGNKGAGPLFEKFIRCNLVPPFAAADAPLHLRCWPKHPNGRKRGT